MPINLISLFKCGFVVGILWSLSQMILEIITIESGLLATAELQRVQISGTYWFVLDVLTGVWAMSLYSLAIAAGAWLYENVNRSLESVCKIEK